jgi:hypothetical protein
MPALRRVHSPGVFQLAAMMYLPIARTFAFVILSTAKDLTNHSASSMLHGLG